MHYRGSSVSLEIINSASISSTSGNRIKRYVYVYSGYGDHKELTKANILARRSSAQMERKVVTFRKFICSFSSFYLLNSYRIHTSLYRVNMSLDELCPDLAGTLTPDPTGDWQ